MAGRISPLITDQYQISMAYSYFLAGIHNDTSTFEMFFRRNPFRGEYAIFAGIDQLLEYIVHFKFTYEELEFVHKTLPNADPAFLYFLSTLSYKQLSVRAPMEGQVIFAHEPIMQISGPLALVQLLETTALALLNYPILVATNACRFRVAVHPELTYVHRDPLFTPETALKRVSLMEFGLRRAYGINGGIAGSRYAMMGGFNVTSNVEAARLSGTLPAGTIAHSFIMAFNVCLEDFMSTTTLGSKFYEFAYKVLRWKHILFKPTSDTSDVSAAVTSETESTTPKRHNFPALPHYTANETELTAFTVFAFTQPQNFLVVIDTYSIIESGLYNFIVVAAALAECDYHPRGIRIDSGDLAYFSKLVREILDRMDRVMEDDFYTMCNHPYQNQLKNSQICVSNDITEEILYYLTKDNAPIDSYGIGTHLITCKSQPALGGVYKLVEINGKPKIKLSAELGKATIAGRKELYRIFLKNGEPYVDLICSPDERPPVANEVITCVHPWDELKRVRVIPAKVEPVFVDYLNEGTLMYPHKLDKKGSVVLKHKYISDIRSFVLNNVYLLRNDHKRPLNPTPYKVSLSEEMSSQYRYIALEYKTIPLIQ